MTGYLPNTSVAVNSGAALTGAGDNLTAGIIGGSATVNGGGLLALTVANSASSLTINGGLTLGNAGVYNAANHATLSYTLAGYGISPVNLGTSGGTTGTLTLNSGGALRVDRRHARAGHLYPDELRLAEWRRLLLAPERCGERDDRKPRPQHVHPAGKHHLAAASDRRFAGPAWPISMAW